MKNQISLNITSPCQENYSQFTPTPNGGFCNSCTKEVIDFTKMNKEEIATFFNKKDTKNTCGRFKNTQLKTYKTNAKKSKLSFISAVGLACLAMLSLTTATAQDKGLTNKTSKINTTQTNNLVTVSGTILDENGLPLPAANIVLQGTTIGVTSDFDGNFEFPKKLKTGDVITFSYVGYESKKVTIKNEDSTSSVVLDVNLNNDNYILMGKVAVDKVYSSKKK